MKKRWKKNQLYNYHHRLPRSKGGTDVFPKDNLVKVRKLKHACYHALFANKSVDEIAEELNSTWIDPRFKLVVKLKDDE